MFMLLTQDITQTAARALLSLGSLFSGAAKPPRPGTKVATCWGCLRRLQRTQCCAGTHVRVLYSRIDPIRCRPAFHATTWGSARKAVVNIYFGYRIIDWSHSSPPGAKYLPIEEGISTPDATDVTYDRSIPLSSPFRLPISSHRIWRQSSARRVRLHVSVTWLRPLRT
jgi:hypothetical protein